MVAASNTDCWWWGMMLMVRALMWYDRWGEGGVAYWVEGDHHHHHHSEGEDVVVSDSSSPPPFWLGMKPVNGQNVLCNNSVVSG